MSETVFILAFSGYNLCDGFPRFMLLALFSYLDGYYAPMCFVVTELFVTNPLPTHL